MTVGLFSALLTHNTKICVTLWPVNGDWKAFQPLANERRHVVRPDIKLDGVSFLRPGPVRIGTSHISLFLNLIGYLKLWLLGLGRILDYNVCSRLHCNSRNSKWLWLIGVTDWSKTGGPHLLLRFFPSLFSVILYKWQQSLARYNYLCWISPAHSKFCSSWYTTWFVPVPQGHRYHPSGSLRISPVLSLHWVRPFGCQDLQILPLSSWCYFSMKRKQSRVSLILIKHFLLSQWKWKTHVGVSSLSMKDKTMLYRNGADVKPFGTSCPAHFPLKSGWGDLLKMLPSCARRRVL